MVSDPLAGDNVPVGPPNPPIGTGRFGWVELVVAVTTLGALQLGFQYADAPLRFERSAIADGELWRLITGHWVHLGWSHFLLNVVTLGILWGFARDLVRPFWWVLLWGGLCVSGGLWVWTPGLDGYVGLSGALHTLFVVGGLQLLARGEYRLGVVLGLAIAFKLGHEQMHGALPSSEYLSGGPVIVDAHLYGAIGGLVWALLAGACSVFRARRGPRRRGA